MTPLEKLIPAITALVLISGCASVTRGTKDTLVIESTPAGADVRLSSGGVGKTPTSFQLPRKRMLDVFIEKEGYEPLTVHVSSQISGTGAVGMAGNVLIGGLIGVGIDSMTGAAKDLRPNPIQVVLVPRKMEAPPSLVATAATAESKPGQPLAVVTPAVAITSAPPVAVSATQPQVEFKPVGTQVGTLHVPRKMEPAQLQDAIAGAFLGRGWDIKETANDHVVGHIKLRSSEAVLAVVFNADLIQMYCEGWKIDKKTGAHIKPALPDSWIDNIRQDLAARLAQTSPAF